MSEEVIGVFNVGHKHWILIVSYIVEVYGHIHVLQSALDNFFLFFMILYLHV